MPSRLASPPPPFRRLGQQEARAAEEKAALGSRDPTLVRRAEEGRVVTGSNQEGDLGRCGC